MKQAVLTMLLAFPALLSAQLGGGSIVGLVTDSQGASVAAGRVRATNVTTNTVSETVTNPQGYFEFPLLPTGPINWAWRKPGFRRPVSTHSR